MSKTVGVIIFIVTILLIGGGLFLATSKPSQSQFGNLDEFAQCLTSKGMTMYGAYWCPHCQNIKKLFASSFQYIKYVECTVETQTCTDKGVSGYPTFIFGDGSRLEGEISLADFAKKTSCVLPTPAK